MEANTAYRPSALRRDVPFTALSASAGDPSSAADRSDVAGVQGPVAPRQVSRMNTCGPCPLVATRLVALDSNDTNRPFALTDANSAETLFWDATPVRGGEARMVVGVQPAGAPTQVSLTKTFSPLMSPGTRFVARLWNTA